MSETYRLQFLVARDGVDAAKAWARRTMRIYRKAVMHREPKPHFASTGEYRRRFIESYLEFKRFD